MLHVVCVNPASPSILPLNPRTINASTYPLPFLQPNFSSLSRSLPLPFSLSSLYTLDSWPHLSTAGEDVHVHARHTSVHILLLHLSHSQAKILQQFVQVQGWAQLRLCLVYAWYLQRASNHLWCPLLCSQFPLSSLSLLLTLWYRRQYLTFERMLAFPRRGWGLPHRGTGHGMIAHCSLYDIP